MEGIDSALSTQKPSEKPPLVLIHGFGAGKVILFFGFESHVEMCHLNNVE